MLSACHDNVSDINAKAERKNAIKKEEKTTTKK